MSLAADHYRTPTAIRCSKMRHARRLLWWSVSLWLAAMAALCTWKAVHYAEAAALLEFLSWPVLSTAGYWWGGAALFGVLALGALRCRFSNAGASATDD